jgi:hypothetical protein
LFFQLVISLKNLDTQKPNDYKGLEKVGRDQLFHVVGVPPSPDALGITAAEYVDHDLAQGDRADCVASLKQRNDLACSLNGAVRFEFW